MEESSLEKFDEEASDHFIIRTEGGHFYLKIDQVFGFPLETSHWGGYDTQSSIDIKTNGFRAKGSLWISTGEIYDFLQELEKFYETLKGKATLNAYEGGISLILEIDNLGHVEISGKFHEYPNKVEFVMTTDQTFLKETLASLNRIHKKYGDNKGVKAN